MRGGLNGYSQFSEFTRFALKNQNNIATRIVIYVITQMGEIDGYW